MTWRADGNKSSIDPRLDAAPVPATGAPVLRPSDERTTARPSDAPVDLPPPPEPPDRHPLDRDPVDEPPPEPRRGDEPPPLPPGA